MLAYLEKKFIVRNLMTFFAAGGGGASMPKRRQNDCILLPVRP
jgi:hypothetical protein